MVKLVTIEPLTSERRFESDSDDCVTKIATWWAKDSPKLNRILSVGRRIYEASKALSIGSYYTDSLLLKDR